MSKQKTDEKRSPFGIGPGGNKQANVNPRPPIRTKPNAPPPPPAKKGQR